MNKERAAQIAEKKAIYNEKMVICVSQHLSPITLCMDCADFSFDLFYLKYCSSIQCY